VDCTFLIHVQSDKINCTLSYHVLLSFSSGLFRECFEFYVHHFVSEEYSGLPERPFSSSVTFFFGNCKRHVWVCETTRMKDEAVKSRDDTFSAWSLFSVVQTETPYYLLLHDYKEL
jgi:hypothetical protein